jgi:hypothetical protein
VVGYNQYSYVGNNPTTLTDPSGRMTMVETATTLFIVGAALSLWCVAYCSSTARGIAGAILWMVELLLEAMPKPRIEEDDTPLPSNVYRFPKMPRQPLPKEEPRPRPWPDPWAPPLPDRRNECGDQGPGFRAYGALDGDRATGAWARIVEAMIGTGTSAKESIHPPGWEPNLHRGHLLGKQLGGTGEFLDNLVTMYPHPNSQTMQSYEGEVRTIVESCQPVAYAVTPQYLNTGSLPVTRILIDAVGEAGYVNWWTVENEPNG